MALLVMIGQRVARRHALDLWGVQNAVMLLINGD
jgi:hypothetical protein